MEQRKEINTEGGNGNKNTEENKLKNLMLKIMTLLPLGSVENIHSAISDKNIRKNLSKQQLEQYIHQLLYDEEYSSSFLKDVPPDQQKILKSQPLNSEEEFIIYMIFLLYGKRTLKELLGEQRSRLLMQHSENQLKRCLEQISTLDPQRADGFISQFAEQVAHEESLAIGEEFSEEDMAESNVPIELYKWWRKSFHMKEEKPEATDINRNELCDVQIEETEKCLEFLTQTKKPFLGTFSTLDGDIYMESKHFLAIDVDHPEAGLDLRILPGYKQSEFGFYGFLMMIKQDCEFYLENIGLAPIFVDSVEVRKGEVVFIKDNACIEIGDPAVIFKINWIFINRLKEELKLL